jgi:molybdenum cofactor biosynthesis protein B
LLAERIQGAGHHLVERAIVKDDIYAIRAAVSAWIANPAVEVVVCTGGTGITGRDGTPEALKTLLDKEIEGFGEMFRTISYAQIGTSSLQSRALAGVANGTYVFSLPGSRNACATAWDELIASQLDFRTRPCNLAELMPRLKE